ncbi:MAG: C-terminal binding protein [Lachnospiraceae bacterium]|nr:C-terminal binding protein [Lachnospiraceae bacterium]
MKKLIYYNAASDLEYEKQLLKQWGITDLTLECVNETDPKRITDDLRDADGAVVIYDRIDKEVLTACRRLKCVSVPSIGYNNLDVEAATSLGVCMTHAPGYCEEEVAEHTVGLLLSLIRKIPYYDRNVRKGIWDPAMGYPVYRLRGKIFGMVFFGHIPRLVAPVVQALGMNVLVYAPTKTREELQAFGCEKADTLEELFETSDVISLHCPLIRGVTEHLVDENLLGKMKESAFLINTSRGEVVDEKALVKALKEHWIRGAAVDVIENEQKAESELFSLEDNTVITPHAAFLSEDSLLRVREMVLQQQIQCLIAGKRPDHLINPDVKKIREE